MSTIQPIKVLQARAEVRAQLLQAAAIPTLGEAIDPLFDYAARCRLPERYGAEFVHALIMKPFLELQLDEA